MQDRPSDEGVPIKARLFRFAPALLVGAGVAGSVLLLWSLRAGELADARGAFEVAAIRRIALTRRELTADVEQLHSLAAFFRSSEDVESSEFSSFTAGTRERRPALVALFWTQRVPSGAWPVRLVLGDPSTELFSMGADLAADPLLRAALERARSSEGLTGSAPLTSPGASGARVLVVLPVPSAPPPDARLVGALLDVDLLLSTGGDPEGEDLLLRAEDVTTSLPARLAGPDAGTGFVRTEELSLGGRRWRFVCSAPPGFVGGYTTLLPWGALVLGLCATALLRTTLSAASRTAEAKRLLERRTEEVQRSYDTLAREAKERLAAVAEAGQLERRLREIIDLDPSMIYVKDWNGSYLLANRATAEAFGTTIQEMTGYGFLHGKVGGQDAAALLREERELMESGLSSVVPSMPFVDAAGRRRILRTVKVPCRVFGGEHSALLCVATDITEQKHAEDALRSQNRILGDLARGGDPERLLADLVGAAEEIVPGMRCSVLMRSADGDHLQHRAAPSLPAFYNAAVDGLPIGPTVGSCGAAAHSGQRVVVEDVLTHPNWEGFRDLARQAGLRACWSQPIRAADGEILGTFAMYYGEPRAPEPFEEELIESMANIAGIAIELARAASDPRSGARG